MPGPVILCILDGWGLDPNGAANAPILADTPNFDRLMATCPNATLITFGPDVGLPTGQMGNSEVGHTNIGAGRVVAMDLGRIDLAVETGSFAQEPALLSFIKDLKASGGTAHLMGVMSDGGVHGHLTHIAAAAHAIADAGVPVILHLMTDGRDVPPSSAQGYWDDLSGRLPAGARVGTVSGRYYAMDRDTRWDRVARAYDAVVLAQGQDAKDVPGAIEQSYALGETDEFLQPTVLDSYAGVQPGDGLFFLNFRADRAREILAALGDPGFAGWDRGPRPDLAARLGMVDYSTQHDTYMTTVFPKQTIVNMLGEWVAKQGKRQFRLAETEKYPHVTFFLNGGRETPELGEDRHMPPSPKVATYDLAPEMAAAEVTEAAVQAIADGYDLIVMNYANPDMVGHTGDLQAAMAACAAVDRGLGAVTTALQTAGGSMIVCADHGNCEVMIDPDTGGPHTAHTTNLVPVLLVGGPQGAGLRAGRLADLAPTVLDLMGLACPDEMTGTSLIT